MVIKKVSNEVSVEEVPLTVLFVCKGALLSKDVKKIIDKYKIKERIIQAETEKEALRAVREYKPDIVFLNIFSHSSEQCFELIQKLKNASQEEHILVVIGPRGRKTVEKAIHFGAFYYLYRPLNE